MRFTKIRLAGFKSFVEPAEFLVEPGLTGIVGPNGCGKSNLVEALQWAMGEGSARRLRGAEMDDVIFGGTRARPARSLASVMLRLELDPGQSMMGQSMTGQSTKGQALPGLPDAAASLFGTASEVEIERRIERGKGSNYRVNGREVRARDVQILFADLASGAASAALVGQGRIGWLISAKPVERRSLLEEAAGISGLQARRHEAELKLAATEQNLLRLDDVAAGLGAQIERLKRQARQAERYRLIAEAVRSAEARLLTGRLRAAAVRAEAAEAALAELEAAVLDAESELDRLREIVAAAAAALEPARTVAADAARSRDRQMHRLRELRDEIGRAIRERDQIGQRLAEAMRDAARTATEIAESDTAALRLAEERAALDAADAREAGETEAAAAAASQLATALTAAERDFNAATARAATAAAERAATARRLAGLEERRQRLVKRLAEAETAVVAVDLLATPETRLAAAAEAAGAAERALREARRRRSEAEERLGLARSREAEAVEPLRRLEAQAMRLAAEIAASERLAAGPGPGRGGYPPVLDRIRVEPGFEAALGAALGEDLGAALDRKAPAFWASVQAESSEVPNWPDDARLLAEVVEAPPQLARRLAQIAIVEDRAAGEAMCAWLKVGQRLVSRDGWLWRWDGFVRTPAGRADDSAVTAQAALLLAERNRLGVLRSERERLEAEREVCRRDRQASAEALAEAEMRRQRLAEAEQAAERELGRLGAAVTALEHEARAAATRRAAASALVRDLAIDLAEAESQIAEAGAEFRRLPPDPAADADEAARLAATKAAIADLREAERRALDARDRLRRDAAARGQRRLAILDEHRASVARSSRARAHDAELAERAAGLRSALAAIEGSPARLEAEIAAGELESRAAAAAAESAGAALERAQHELAAQQRLVDAAAALLADRRERRVRASAERDYAAQALDRANEALKAALGCNPAELPSELPADFPGAASDEAVADLAALERHLEQLKRDRDAIGPVNLVAESEAAELGAERSLIEAESADLRAAIAKLREAIRTLDGEGRQRLMAAFERIDRHFRQLFTQLFGGGQAHLALTGAPGPDGAATHGETACDPLNAGLEIFASPPGKKSQILSLLSGGERALTALALIFAMFLTNPAPICVLDEVDAPLDDANVERFCNLVRDIARRTSTRFLIVTHHRVTMAGMDRLYGVTMAEQGVSRLVSVALAEAERMRESA